MLNFDRDDARGYRLRVEKMQMPKRTKFVYRTAPVQVNKYVWLREKSKL